MACTSGTHVIYKKYIVALGIVYATPTDLYHQVIPVSLVDVLAEVSSLHVSGDKLFMLTLKHCS